MIGFIALLPLSYVSVLPFNPQGHFSVANIVEAEILVEQADKRPKKYQKIPVRLAMGLKVRLAWYNKRTEREEGKELSSDFGDDVAVLVLLELSAAQDINNGEFDVKDDWLAILQPLFVHQINLDVFDYQVSFNYKK